MADANSTSNVTSFLPPGEDSLDLFTERTELVGVFTMSVIYGQISILFFACLYYLIAGKRRTQIAWGYVAYVFALFSAMSVYYGTGAKYAQQMFIDDRNYPGGPIGFYENDVTDAVIPIGSASYLVANALADGLVLYRCYLIYNYNKWVIGFPVLMYLAWIACAIIDIWSSTQATVFITNISDFGVAWVSLSMALNIILTCMIIGRLLVARRQLIKVLGKKHAQLYTNIMALVIESASIQALTSVLFLILYGPVNPWMNTMINVFSPMLTIGATVSPLLILLRVARGRAFTETTMTSTSRMDFSKTSGVQSSTLPMSTFRSATQVDVVVGDPTWPRKGSDSAASVSEV